MFTVRVPATSANLGAGFDCLGLALPIYNEVRVRRREKLIVHTDPGFPSDESNLVVRSMKAACDAANAQMPAVEIWQTNGIPSTSGLGSSAACIVAGLTAANELLGGVLPRSELLNLAARAEGHPDNVAPAFEGGITASVMTDRGVEVFCAPASDRYRLALLTPRFQLSTKKSRGVLPERYERADVVFNVSRAVATFEAFRTGDPDRIARVIGDRMHEPYRLPLIPGAAELFGSLRAAGAYATYLSGAGPTLAAVVPNDFSFRAPEGWTLRIVPVASRGAEVIYAD